MAKKGEGEGRREEKTHQDLFTKSSYHTTRSQNQTGRRGGGKKRKEKRKEKKEEERSRAKASPEYCLSLFTPTAQPLRPPKLLSSQGKKEEKREKGGKRGEEGRGKGGVLCSESAVDVFFSDSFVFLAKREGGRKKKGGKKKEGGKEGKKGDVRLSRAICRVDSVDSRLSIFYLN